MRTKIPTTKLLCQLAAIVALSCTFITKTTVAQTPGGTSIENLASVVFTDSDGNPFTAVLNTVTTAVANVSGLTITPEAGTRPNIVAVPRAGELSLPVPDHAEIQACMCV